MVLGSGDEERLLKSLLDVVVGHPIWTMVGALAAVVGVLVAIWLGTRRDAPARPVTPAPPVSLSVCGFSNETDLLLQRQRQDIYMELFSTLSQPPASGTPDAIHATFNTHSNRVGRTIPIEESRQCHLGEVRALDRELQELLGSHEVNGFTGDTRFAIGRGINNMALIYER